MKLLLLISFILLFLPCIASDEDMQHVLDLVSQKDFYEADKFLEEWKPESNLETFFCYQMKSSFRTHYRNSQSEINLASQYISQAETAMQKDFQSYISDLSNFVRNLSEDQISKIRNYNQIRWQKPVSEFFDYLDNPDISLNNSVFFIIYNILQRLKIELTKELEAKYLMMNQKYKHYLYDSFVFFKKRLDNLDGWDNNIENLSNILISLKKQTTMTGNPYLAKDVHWLMLLADQRHPEIATENFKYQREDLSNFFYLLPESDTVGGKI